MWKPSSICDLAQDELPQNVLIISDMEFDQGVRSDGMFWEKDGKIHVDHGTLMENIRIKYARMGYNMPNLVYWNVNARNDRIADSGPNVTFVSGYSPVILEQVLKNKKGYDLMMDKLNSERYEPIKL